MRRALLVLLITGIVTVIGSIGWLLSTLDIPGKLRDMATPAVTKPEAPDKKVADKQADKVGDATDAARATAKRIAERQDAERRNPVAIEVARLDAGGASVFAGRAPSGSHVTLLVNGHRLTSTIASDDGQWSVIVTEGVPSGEVKLGIFARPADGGAIVLGAVDKLEVPKPAVAEVQPQPTAPRPDGQTALASATAKLPVARPPPATAAARREDLRKFEAFVDRARQEANPKSAAEPKLAAAPAPTSPLAMAGPKGNGQDEPVPVPITFASDATDLTEEGAEAARLLLEYLLIKKPRAITLSGHADDRGTDIYNLGLSERRLAVIARMLRAGGYQGGLALMAKGKSEPFAAIDRDKLSPEEVWQADRRVELRLIR